MYGTDHLLKTAAISVATVAVLAAMVGCNGTALAQTYPTKPITMIVPFAAGGTVDAIPRIVAEHMQGSLGQAIIVENIGGAGGTIGTGRVARAVPNGYTLGLGTFQTHVRMSSMALSTRSSTTC